MVHFFKDVRRQCTAAWAAAAGALFCLAGPLAAWGTEPYVEMHQAWSASAAATWVTHSLAGSPYNVPAGAVLEVAIRNRSTLSSSVGGLRAVGSSTFRAFQLAPANSSGANMVAAHVQANASSQVQYYVDSTSNIDFLLMGYWTSGTYVELGAALSVSAANTWEDENLAPHGVAPGKVVDVVIATLDTSAAHLVGVRTNGSSVQRRIQISPAAGSGAHAITLFAVTDQTANATIELYTSDTIDVDFYIAGYWSTPPGTFVAASDDLGSPATDGAWGSVDLTSLGVPPRSIIEVILSNQHTGSNNMGVRQTNGSLARFVRLSPPVSGGWLACTHVMADCNAAIALYHEDVSDAHSFVLTGYWIANGLPDAPAELGPEQYVTAQAGIDGTPTLEFGLADDDQEDDLFFEIQIDDVADFSSPVVDYVSGYGSQGEHSFTVGQPPGDGKYFAGNAGQVLARSRYYWRVRASDCNGNGAWSAANDGDVGFYVGLPSAGICP